MRQITVAVNDHHYGVLASWADDYETTPEDMLRRFTAYFWMLDPTEKTKLMQSLQSYASPAESSL